MKNISIKAQKKLFYSLLRIRIIEETISKKYSEWKMRCPVHLSIGQEAGAVGIGENLSINDEVFSGHRSHAHYLAKKCSLKKMIAEMYGKSTGCALGRGGSQHLKDLDKNFHASIPIVGSVIPIAVGKAWGNQLNKKKNIVIVFFGDGATEEGVFLESLDFASLKNLNIIFVCENNFYSVYTPLNLRQINKNRITNIARATGVDTLEISSNDVAEIFLKTKKVIKKVKENSRPYLIKINTYRHLEHCGPNYDDDLNYRSKKEINNWIKKDPINIYQKKLLNNKVLSIHDINGFKKKILEEVNNAFLYAERSPFPKKELLTKYIYKN